MIFFCSGCETVKDNAELKRCVTTSDKQKLLKFCRSCIKGTATVPDVYFDGKPEHGLANDPATGNPRVFSSKAAKAAYLKERGLVEAGDRVRGSYPAVEGPTKADTRAEVQEALRQVAQMSPSQRRAEYLRITRDRR